MPPSKLSQPPVIALVGGVASGKTTAGRIFEAHGFTPFECSRVLKDWLRENGNPNPNRDDYSNAADHLRRTNGCDFLTRETVKRIRQYWEKSGVGPVILSGMRRPEPIHYLRGEFGERALVIGIQATIEQRIDRIRSRLRGSDLANLAAIQNDIEREWFNPDNEFGNRLREVMPLCDVTIDNSGSLEKMTKELNSLISEKIITP